MARRGATARLALVRMHEATASARDSWSAAVLAAIDEARTQIDGHEVIGFEVVRFAGDVRGRTISGYRATVRVAYRESAKPPKRS